MNGVAARGPLAGMRAQDRRALAIGAVALVALLGYSRVLKPGFVRLSLERQQVADESALLVRERALITAAPALPARLRQVHAALGAEQPRLFTGDSVAAAAELTTYASQVAKVAGVQLETVEARTPVTSGGVTQLTADVRGEGGWREVLTFVRLLEVSGQLVEVSNLRLERGVRGGPLGGDLISITATLAGYARGAK